MNFKDVYRKLERNKYYIFSYKDIMSFYPDEKGPNLKKILYRWNKKGHLASLKKGLYELTYPKDFIIPDMHVANKLYSPSYVSLETALSNYSIIPEVSMGVTSLTTKPTRRFKNKHGLFIYRTIKADCFTGYYVERQHSFDILIAEPEKAFVDYLYFRKYRNKKFNLKDQRIDRDLVLRLNKRRLNKYAGLYKMDLKEIYAYL